MVVSPVVIVPELPDPFKLSYRDFESYPRNLIYRTTCMAEIKAYEARLDEASPTLFIRENEAADGEDKAADVRFRDFGERGKYSHSPFSGSALTPCAAFAKHKIFNDPKLKDWIGDQSSIDPLVATLTGPLATKPDPKCRFM